MYCIYSICSACVNIFIEHHVFSPCLLLLLWNVHRRFPRCSITSDSSSAELGTALSLWRSNNSFCRMGVKSTCSIPSQNLCAAHKAEHIIPEHKKFELFLHLPSDDNQSHLFIKPFLHQLMSQSAVQKPSLKPQTASNADVEARWLGKTP